MSSRAAGSRILLVEDDEDTRQLLALALEGRGYVVDQAATPGEALARLRGQRYRLVITDYELPGQTGTAMLKDAVREGWVRDTAMMVVTAHPQPELVAGADLVQKPLEIAGFLGQVNHILEAMPGPPSPPAAPGPGCEAGPAVELVLYVTADSPASQRARRHLDAALTRFPAEQVHLEVCDVGADAIRGERDRVVFTPTLVARCGGLATWVLGDLADRDLLMDLLHVCGLEPHTR
jgi:CheY-like chemotaxis protein